MGLSTAASRIIRSLIPVEDGFFRWFERSGDLLVQASGQLDRMVGAYAPTKSGDPARLAAEIRETEHHADQVVHEVHDLLHRSLVPPFDRATIMELVHAVDNVVDAIDDVADRLLLHEVAQPRPELARLVRVLDQAAAEVHAALPLLRDRSNMARIKEHAIAIQRLENEGDTLARAATAALRAEAIAAVRGGASALPVMEFLSWTEIIDLLESAIDGCEDVADVLFGIVVENA